MKENILFFDNYPEAKLALGKISYPAIIKPHSCEDSQYIYEVKDYGAAAQSLYDAFEHSPNNWVIIIF